ncbi:MGMT family protein [Streptantibioticus silvisoli]|uniref:MGMT family protein n=1 Tax=Streptantibioticus silvisoli TaxID=2705255 RepID=A0ABT6W4J4_9ACTN|nr:MGMT family protein [Streptantibioticus silvisoli]MDI5965668.1 MGMT family protein [Streptantibioticus silvisoli]
MDHLFTVSGQKAIPVARTGLAAEGLLERRHLQEWVIAHPQVLGESVLVVTAEFDRWADADGVPAKDRLDVLGLDATGRLVVVELKRGMADRDVHLQAITYAALVSRFDLRTLAQAHHRFRVARGETVTEDECRQRLLDHVDGEWDPELLQRPRLVVIAAEFPKQVTHTVVWLSEMNLDIDLVQVSLWKVEGHLVAGFTKVYPTPEVEEITLGPARMESEAAAKKIKERSRVQNAVHVLVGTGLLPDGTRLRLVPQHGAPEAIRERITVWAAETDGRSRAVWNNNTAKPLTWGADGKRYSATGLAEHIFTAVTGRTASGIQGTTWWVVDADHVPDGVDPDEWAAVAEADLVQLAKQAGGTGSTGRDWTDLHTVLAAIPSGRWTTYGDVAAAINSHALPVGTHIGNCGQCPNAWRVLTVKRRVSARFRWTDPERTDTAVDVLRSEGILFDGSTADRGFRMTAQELSQSLNG